MSNTSITNLQITDTFQIWINKTNEVIDLANENVMLAGPGIGFTVQGNSTLEGTFTADELISDTATLGAIFTNTLTRSVDAAEPILSSSPIRINTSVENILNLESTSGNKPNLRMINGGNARWNLGHVTTTASSAFNIKTEAASTPQLSISQAGRVTAVEFQGDGNRLTNINPNNIAAGTFAVANIPNLDANKITTGTLVVDRIPNLNASKITAGEFNVARIPNLDAGKIATGIFADARIPNLNASKITAGTFADARIPNLNASKITAGTLSADRIPNLDGSKITTGTIADARIPTTIVRTSRSISTGTGLDGGGNLSANRTISISNGGVGTTQLATNERMTTANVLSQISSAGFAAVGTHALLRAVSGSPIAAGSTFSGFNLAPATAGGVPRASGSTIIVVSGTWRAIGQTSEAGQLTTAARPNQTTLFLRIA